MVELEKKDQTHNLRLGGAILNPCASDISAFSEEFTSGRGAILTCLKEKQRDSNATKCGMSKNIDKRYS